jgi:choline dehydrogenase-like flavoprotein
MTKDPFSGDGFGGYTNAATIVPVTKTRSYATNAYYEPVPERPNLQVITGALVERILLETAGPADHRATAVKYQKDGTIETAKARREVILSAGTFNSPKILELSGIGSACTLERHQIPVVINNADVGENRQDHGLSGSEL